MAGVVHNLSSSQMATLESLNTQITDLQERVNFLGDYETDLVDNLNKDICRNFKGIVVTYSGLGIAPGTSIFSIKEIVTKRLDVVKTQMKRIAKEIPGVAEKHFIEAPSGDELAYIRYKGELFRLILPLTTILEPVCDLKEKIASREALLLRGA